jgi:hypothetical protein
MNKHRSKKYLSELLELIHILVKRCGGKVSWRVPYGGFTIHTTRELLTKTNIKFKKDEEVMAAAHRIAERMEEIIYGKEE